MNPKTQVIEQAIMDLEENREMVSQIYNEYRETKQGPGYYKKVEELDAAMEKAREERTNIAVRLFRDYVDYQGNPVVGNPNEAFYDPNPTPIFSVGDFHRGRPGGRHFPRTMPAITGARTKHAQTGRSTLKRIDKFIEQLKYKMKKRKDLQESNLFQLTEAKLKQMILDEMKSNLPLADQEMLRRDIDKVRTLSAEIDMLREISRMPSGFEGRTNVVSSAELEQSIKDMEDLYHRIQTLDNEVRAIANKYDIEFYFDEPGNEDLIRLMKNKFRRKSL
tara:strand:+ start:396 stop:1226 length:831 start_codon:yes stop_codon:yes gene_type:complete